MHVGNGQLLAATDGGNGPGGDNAVSETVGGLSVTATLAGRHAGRLMATVRVADAATGDTLALATVNLLRDE